MRLGRDEIDIIAFDPHDRVLVFAEVKMRTQKSADFPARMSAGWRKCEKLRRSARRWVCENSYEGGYRIDLICIEGGKVTQHLRELDWGE